MVQINFARKEVNCKIVYYGPGLCGKTTNIEAIHEKVPANAKGKLTSIATEGDRTLFFDFLPIDLGEVAGMKTKFQLYTVPGQVYYNATRKLVLQGTDGVVMVYDSNPDRMEDNIESLRNLKENLKENSLDVENIPLVIQYNKRDVQNAMNIHEMSKKLNPYSAPEFEAIATKREGVMQTLKALSKLVLEKLNEDYSKKETVTPMVQTNTNYVTTSVSNNSGAEIRQKVKSGAIDADTYKEHIPIYTPLSQTSNVKNPLKKEMTVVTKMHSEELQHHNYSAATISSNQLTKSVSKPKRESYYGKIHKSSNRLQLIMLGIIFLILAIAVIAIVVVIRRG